MITEDELVNAFKIFDKVCFVWISNDGENAPVHKIDASKVPPEPRLGQEWHD